MVHRLFAFLGMTVDIYDMLIEGASDQHRAVPKWLNRYAGRPVMVLAGVMHKQHLPTAQHLVTHLLSRDQRRESSEASVVLVGPGAPTWPLLGEVAAQLAGAGGGRTSLMNKLSAVDLLSELGSERWAEKPAVAGVPVAWRPAATFACLAATLVSGLSLEDRLVMLTSDGKGKSALPCLQEPWQGGLGAQYRGGFADVMAATLVRDLRDDMLYDGARFPNFLELIGALALPGVAPAKAIPGVDYTLKELLEEVVEELAERVKSSVTPATEGCCGCGGAPEVRTDKVDPAMLRRFTFVRRHLEAVVQHAPGQQHMRRSEDSEPGVGESTLFGQMREAIGDAVEAVQEGLEDLAGGITNLVLGEKWGALKVDPLDKTVRH
jgi:hypothetical protein